MPYVLGTTRLEDRAGNDFDGSLGGIYVDTPEQAQHDMYAYPFHSVFVAGDEKIGAYIIDDTTSPAVTWTLQRRRPHAGIYLDLNGVWALDGRTNYSPWPQAERRRGSLQ